MIRQIRILGLSMLAVFAVGVVMSASASAHEFSVCREGGTSKYQNNLCGKKTETGKFSLLPVVGAEKYVYSGIGGVVTMESERTPTVNTLIECKKNKQKGEIEAGGKSKNVHFIFEECASYFVESKIKHNTGCTIPNIETRNLNGALITGTGGGLEDELSVPGGFAIFEFELTSCALERKQTLTGKLSCLLPEASVGEVAHELVCSASSSGLQLDSRRASYFSATPVNLEAGLAWRAE